MMSYLQLVQKMVRSEKKTFNNNLTYIKVLHKDKEILFNKTIIEPPKPKVAQRLFNQY